MSPVRQFHSSAGRAVPRPHLASITPGAHTPPMLLSIGADEKAALHFDDLASALDAGLSLDSLGGRPAHGELVVHDLLRQRGVKLSDSESAVLVAAWRGGRIAPALRNRAEDRRRRAQFARRVWEGLRYPVFLLVFMFCASLVVMAVRGTYLLPILVVMLFVVVGLGSRWLFARFRRGDDAWLRVPWFGRLAMDLGELPYLETLHALYGAGMPLVQAHAAAVAAVPVAGVQRRLRIADRILAGGRSLTDSLQESLSLHTETRTLLATGEKSGQLEEALHKALGRRRDVASRGVADTARWLGILAYATAVLFAAIYIVTIYSNIYKMAR